MVSVTLYDVPKNSVISILKVEIQVTLGEKLPKEPIAYRQWPMQPFIVCLRCLDQRE